MNGEEAGFAKWLMQLLWVPFLSLIALVFKQQQSSFKTQVDAAQAAAKSAGDSAAAALMRHGLEDEKQFESVHEELQVQRGHIAKLFDKLEEHSRRSEDRHVELLKSLHEGLRTK